MSGVAGAAAQVPRHHRWTTESVPPAERFGYWREAVHANFRALSPERPEGAAFDGRMSAWLAGDFAVLETDVTAHRSARSRRDVARAPLDGVLIYLERDAGSGFEACGQEFRTAQGQIIMGDGDEPFLIDPCGATMRYTVLRVPHKALTPMVPMERLRQSRILPPDGMGGVLSGFLQGITTQLPKLTAAQAEASLQHFCDLLALAIGGACEVAPGREALRAARLAEARRLVERMLADPGLSAVQVAAALGISERQLHLLFEPGGESFARFVQRRRLDRVDALLRDPAMQGRSVADIAFAVGFESLATFYRAFQRAYGCTPTERRGASESRQPA